MILHELVQINSVLCCSYLNISFLVFFIGVSGIIFNYRNLLLTILSIELMYLGVVVSFIIISTATYDPKGQVYALVFIILAASESAIGLGILIVLYRFGKTIEYKHYQKLKG